MPSPPFNPMHYQPLMPFFDIEVGDLKKIYDGPRIPIGMRISQNSGKAFMVDLDFYDDSGFEVEEAFATSKEPNFRFRFGYQGSNPYTSKWYTVNQAMIKSMGLSMMVKVVGVLVGESSAMVSSNPMSGTIKELIDELADLHKIQVSYNPPFGVDKMSDSGYNNDGDTDIQEKLHIKYADETDKNFINRLLKYARDDNGRGGYMAIWGQDENGQDTLNICLPDDSNHALEYTYPCTDVWNVIDWQPSINVVMATIQGGSGTHIHAHEQSTGDQIKFVLDPALTKDYQTSLGNPLSRPIVQTPDPGAPDDAIHRCSETMDQSVVTNSVRTYSVGPMSSMARANLALNYQLEMSKFNNEATLVLIGDPGIDETYIGKMLKMNAWRHKTYNEKSARVPHWSTGNWSINGYEHTMNPGNFQTTLFLNRVGSEGLLVGQPIEDGPDNAQTEVGGVVLNP